ncbi:hypothetical protein FH163_07275 [Staphylococcus lugdunensis]|uniref:Uncharacterized protein n=2 Tax=Staphylococcus TaxID=1279 RepID=A0ABX6BQ94_STALU|nr:hypothetical protein [Staphylococcus lugdunensis]ARJ08529.1 hypothetical protein B7454_03720 [Staphylococcus lugdunensis]ARJ15611.1 hypothetical protein B6N54_02960 [Staphylococcus lugdunensis]ARJ29001.1 hypothetical protein B6N84_02990 [Staphylococcus lugdunensis]MCH8656602.1 hypothetical protein [Staphylococcus lugdunensis]MCH8668514.1 hypothetical protein [Staphylococcus lugdunensis]
MNKAWYKRIFNPVNYCQYLVHSLKHNYVLGSFRSDLPARLGLEPFLLFKKTYKIKPTRPATSMPHILGIHMLCIILSKILVVKESKTALSINNINQLNVFI